MSGDTRMARMKLKLEGMVKSGQLYEAEQLYGTLASRHRSGGQVDDAVALLDEGIRVLARHGRSQGAVQLSKNLLAILPTPARTNVASLELLMALFDSFDDRDVKSKLEFAKLIVKWTESYAFLDADLEKLHGAIAMFCDRIDEYADGQPHFLRCRQYSDHSKFMIKWSRSVQRGEVDLLVARCILQYLCLRNVEGANSLFSALSDLVHNHSESPLMHFIAFLLKTIERDAAPLFTMLREKYAPSISRDETFNAYLDRIGNEYFGITAIKTGLAGLLDNLMGPPSAS